MPMIRRWGGRAGPRFCRIAIPWLICTAPGADAPEMRQSALSRREDCTLWPAGRSGVIIGHYDRLPGGHCMSLNDRIEALREKHALLERAIHEEVHRPLPNQDAVHDLKRQKLRIKDEIFQLESQ